MMLSGRFLERPLLCAIEPSGLSCGQMADAIYRLVMPSWMLLADQRETYRARPAGSLILTPWGEKASLVDLSEDGLAFVVATHAQSPVSTGTCWAAHLLDEHETEPMPLELSIVYSLPQWTSGIRIGARIHTDRHDDRLALHQLIARHVCWERDGVK